MPNEDGAKHLDVAEFTRIRDKKDVADVARLRGNKQNPALDIPPELWRVRLH